MTNQDRVIPLPRDKQGEFGYGDVWTFVAIDAATKLIPSWLVGLRNAEYAHGFMSDLASRLASHAQLTTDGHRMYLEAVEGAFGSRIDYAMLVKLYGNEPEREVRYSPATCVGAEKESFKATPTPNTYPQATLSARTSQCE